MFRHWKTITVRMAILPTLIYRFNRIPIKIPAAFAEVDQLIIRFIRKYKGTQNSQNNDGKEQRGHAAGFQNYHKASVI